MDVNKLNQSLRRIYSEDDTRVVFWNDPGGEFESSLSKLDLGDVNLLRLDEVGALAAKRTLEREQLSASFLIYSPSEEPIASEDWLLDIRLYSKSFRADRTSILIEQLGLARQSLRSHLSERKKFFDNQDRIAKLKALVDANDDELDLDRKMMAVLARADRAEFFILLRTLCDDIGSGEHAGLSTSPTSWALFEKYGLVDSFWRLVEAHFGYRADEPSLKGLLLRLMATDIARGLKADPPTQLVNLILPASFANAASFFLGQWRDSSRHGESYNLLSDEVGREFGVSNLLSGYQLEELQEAVTFAEVEKSILRALLERVHTTQETMDAAPIRELASQRQAKHWIASLSVAEGDRKARCAFYEALALAADFFALRNQYRDSFSFDDAKAMYRAYETELHRFDQLYRLFCEQADTTEQRGWDVVKKLRDDIETIYVNWYLPELALGWGRFVEKGLLQNWELPEVPNQYNFFASKIADVPGKKPQPRTFVIISDALRYEVAQELIGELNGKYRFKAELSSQLGVLPSYTRLGMASLLPHETLKYTAKGAVLADGKSTDGLQSRSEVLATREGIAIKGGDLLRMSAEEGKAFASDKRFLYIYHDEIDARGDKAATEKETFAAARKTVHDIGNLVRYIINSLNGNRVVITADHGFLYTHTAPDETDKSKLDDKPKGTVVAKKRYLVGHKLGESESAWHGFTQVTAKAEGEMEFWIPKGTSRFHFTGGARFVHGGAMLQEIVVPVITVKHFKNPGQREKTRTKKVSVQVLGRTPHKVTTQKHRFRLLQTEPVSERVKARVFKMAIYEGNEAVSTIETVAFDSTSSSLDEREYSVTLSLTNKEFDKRTPYSLVLHDADGVERQRIDVIIDRAYSNDFDF